MAATHRRTADGTALAAPEIQAIPFPPEGRRRVVIESITPEIDGGRFPVKRTVGESVHVEADIFADGHDEIAAWLLYRPVSPSMAEDSWERVALTPLGNDRWTGSFVVEQLGAYKYTLEAQVDPFHTWWRDLLKRLDAGQNVRVDLQIGVRLVQAAIPRAPIDVAQRLKQWCAQVVELDAEALRQLVVDPEIHDLVNRWQPPHFRTRADQELTVTVERERARFSAWYEMFPRSASAEPDRHGTLQDVIARLPYVAEMGFDVLYLPPIHPIGVSFRKGRNNSTTAEPEDVGSPWAIGNAEGGHTAILKDLGTLADFDALVSAAQRVGIEIALDIAIQCAPEHPYVAEHPEWFRVRPDGTIQYAENPPKKYQDIYPLNFESADWQNLWLELKSIFEFWIARGVKIFRVDNPHTKAFPFWEWCLNSLRQTWPELIFLSEAFTRPRVKYRLAKLGFTQSYTYFAWRHNRHELQEYLTELTSTDIAEFFRPNFWPNTPDILTEELQHGGRPAFMRRLVLAATLSSNYGIYGPPFEHLWCLPIRPGSEEYLNSEKYQLHTHDLQRPDSLKGLIARINRIRRENKALQYNANLQFHAIENEQLLCYSKTCPQKQNVIVVAVNLDSHATQSGFVELPIQEFGLASDEPYQMHDLLTDARYMWYGSRNYIELHPHKLPAHVFHIRRRMKSESGREYFQ